MFDEHKKIYLFTQSLGVFDSAILTVAKATRRRNKIDFDSSCRNLHNRKLVRNDNKL